MNAPFVILAYFGPETVLPLTSIVATIAGLFLMFGRYTFRLLAQWGRSVLVRRVPAKGPRAPHFSRRQAVPTASRRR